MCESHSDSLHLVFVNYEKAFNCLNHKHLWPSFRAQGRNGVPEKIVNLIKAQYEAFVCLVVHNEGWTRLG